MMISLCHININSITKHKDELLARFSNYDIISVNETNLKSERSFSLLGYNIFRNDRVGQMGGGVLLAVKKHIKCREILNKTTRKNEVIAVEIETKSFKSILISSIYVPPTADIDRSVFEELYNINNNCIIVGDLNATLYEMGSQLQQLIKEGFIECIDDDSPTFERNDYEVKLDWILASQPLLSFISNVETHPTIDTLTGHKPITFDIPIGVEPKPSSPRISFNFKAAKWSIFRSKLDQRLKL
jgi:exonuclease III